MIMAIRRRGAKAAAIPVFILFFCSWLLFAQFRSRVERAFPASAAEPEVEPATPSPPPVEIVVASLKNENTDWVHRHLSEWTRSIYVTDDPSAELTVPKNKGREAMVYLTHMIDRYDTLAPITVFSHSGRFAWHNDDPDYDALPTLKHLQLDYVRSSGYVNLRCVWVLGCPNEIRPHADALEGEKAKALDPDKPINARGVYKQAFQELMPGMEVPDVVGVSCCSQFAVSREAVHRHPRESYIRWRKWLLQTDLVDDLSGRVLEYTWHIIFGKGSVFCPNAGDCYCKVFGLCDLDCGENKCEGRYVLPAVASLPRGWPKIGWYDEPRNFSGPLP